MDMSSKHVFVSEFLYPNHETVVYIYYIRI